MGPTEQTVAGWILEERLGSGGFGEVWRARKRRVDLVRAVKLTPIGSELAFASWRHEIGRLEALSHPNIVRFYDADIVSEEGPYRDHAWIATELCERSLGQEMHDRVRMGHGFSDDEAEQLVDQMLAALTAAHDDACVHRDIKPGNILRHASGSWKLCDFGTARLVPQGESHPHTAVIGTSPYMSAAAHRGRQDYAADLYALGVTVHEVLSGERLHPRPPGMSDIEHVALILDTPPSVSASLSERWQRVIRGLTGIDGPVRPARELYGWFREGKGHTPLPATRPTALVPPDPPDGITRQTIPQADLEHLARPTEVQASYTAPAQPEPRQPQQVFVPAPPEPAPQPVAPQAPPQRPAPPPPQADPWAPTAVLGRRAVAFVADMALIWLVATIIWAVAYQSMLGLAYDRVGSDTVGPDANAYCRIERLEGRDCRIFNFVFSDPEQGDVYVRDGSLWSSGQIGTTAAGLVMLYLWVLRQGRRGTTPGKRLTGIRTVGPGGGPPGRGRALVRTALLAVDMFAWPFLLLSASTDHTDDRRPQARRRVGDRVANTWVMRRRPG